MTNDSEPSSICNRRITRTRTRNAEHQRACRYFAAFPTRNPKIPFVEFTVVAPTRKLAAQIARAAAKPLGLSMMEMD